MKTINQVAAHIRQLGYKSTAFEKENKIIVETDKVLNTTQLEISNRIKGRNVPVPVGRDPAHIKVEGYKIFVRKPNSSRKISGPNNERKLNTIINVIMKNYGPGVNINLEDKEGKIFRMKNVKRSVHQGHDVSDRKKADVVVYGDEVYPISLKMHSAERWESAVSFWKDQARHYLERAVNDGLVELTNNGENTVITPNLAIEATDQEVEHLVFGSDILPNGCIATNTFLTVEVKYDSETNTATIMVENIIRTLDEIPEGKKVWMVIRNNSGRPDLKPLVGLRVEASYATRAFGGTTKRITKEQR